jgi:Tfp pilus assembly protein PilF
MLFQPAPALSSSRLLLGALAVLTLLAAPARAADPVEADKLLAAGKYEEVAGEARAAIEQGDRRWRQVLVRALTATGQRAAAAQEAKLLVQASPDELPALLLARDTFRAVGDEAAAAAALARLRQAAATPGRKLEEAEELVAAGRAALLAGDEPKTVLATYFERALGRDPACKAAYLAGGQLALDKSDDRLAAEWFERGLAKLGPDADLYAGLARAHYDGDREEMKAALDAALHLNPRQVPALLLRAEHEIDGEDYAAAAAHIDRALAVDAGVPAGWALRAVLAHLRNDGAGEGKARQQALAAWSRNPGVDALIGRKLSQKYRFTEGAAYQRRALALDPGYLPAKAQLAQDLLRLGVEHADEGWALAEQVHAKDGYDVEAFNLVTLRGHMARFATLRHKGFVVRMDPGEARIYGDEVGALLAEASRTLDARYGFSRSKPVAVEIFPDQSDFAVRTFGMPGGSGYLGVCFGGLITMNSPAGTGAAPVSWRSILWHEYAHVITLGLTGNRIPRWLSEGISVHEEMKADPRWGQGMTAAYRQMILGGELLPLGKLSTAFLSAKTPEHVMFAYYQSALAVEYLVQKHGLGVLRAVLGDLGRGVQINQALAARAAPLAELDAGFAAFARAQAEAFAPRADFREPAPGVLGDDSGKALAEVLRQQPNNVPALLAQARRHMERGAWGEARPLLERVIALGAEPGEPHLMLAEVQRKQGRAADEQKTLEALAGRSAGVAPAFARLIELAEGRGDVAAMGENGERLLGVNPMLEAGWRARGRAREAGGDAGGAIRAYERLLLLEPADTADTHLRLARLQQRRDRRAARRHVLDALAEAPRLLPAHRLLLELGP